MLPVCAASPTMPPSQRLSVLNSLMTRPGKNIAVLGSTGSIGRNALEVIANSGGNLQAKALSAHNNVNLLREQAVRFRPKNSQGTRTIDQVKGTIPWNK